ncbi:MAG: hypothetical protein RLZZ519_3103, partial [Bacteroidota bacterium]
MYILRLFSIAAKTLVNSDCDLAN